ncbi:MAG: 6-bladed beta-propeller, partial [Nitrospirota bacterium]
DLTNKDYGFIGDAVGVGQLGLATGIAIAGDGRIFVTDVGQDRVFVYSQDHKFLAAVGSEGEFISPSSVAIDNENGIFYIVDTRNHVVKVYDLRTYRYVRSIGSRGQGEDGKFNFPTNAVVDSKGNVYIVDTGNFQVQVFDSQGNFVRKFGQLGDNPGSFARPKGIGIDSDDNIYIVDTAFQNVQIFNKDGQLLLFFGIGGSGPGRFTLPAGLTVDSQDRVLVVDQLPASVHIFQYLKPGGN